MEEGEEEEEERGVSVVGLSSLPLLLLVPSFAKPLNARAPEF